MISQNTIECNGNNDDNVGVWVDLWLVLFTGSRGWLYADIKEILDNELRL